jgi:hypothetical protein
MKKLTFLSFILLSFQFYAQIGFKDPSYDLSIVSNGKVIELSAEKINVRFPSKRQPKLIKQESNKFIEIDGQIIQLNILEVDGVTKKMMRKDTAFERTILTKHSEYEMNYFRKDLGLKIINPENQWVIVNGRGWLIWYFKLGNVPKKGQNQFELQLYATTLVGDKIILINAPMLKNTDFGESANMVNELMESMLVK